MSRTFVKGFGNPHPSTRWACIENGGASEIRTREVSRVTGGCPKPLDHDSVIRKMEPVARIELATPSLQVKCSTN